MAVKPKIPAVKISMSKKGDWTLAREILASESKLKTAINNAVMLEAERAKSQIVKGIKDQAPAGKKFKPLSPLTLIMRQAKGFKGTKALIVTAALMNAIKVIKIAPGIVSVGIPPGTKTRVGGTSLYAIGRMNEFGATITVRVTKKMRNYLMMMLRKSHLKELSKRKDGRDSKGRFSAKTSMPKGTGAMASGVMVIKIPPRPFIGPVMDVLKANQRVVNMRIQDSIAKAMKGKLGK